MGEGEGVLISEIGPVISIIAGPVISIRDRTSGQYQRYVGSVISIRDRTSGQYQRYVGPVISIRDRTSGQYQRYVGSVISIIAGPMMRTHSSHLQSKVCVVIGNPPESCLPICS